MKAAEQWQTHDAPGARNCFDMMTDPPYGYQNRFPAARAPVDAALAAGGEAGKPVWLNG